MNTTAPATLTIPVNLHKLPELGPGQWYRVCTWVDGTIVHQRTVGFWPTADLVAKVQFVRELARATTDQIAADSTYSWMKLGDELALHAKTGNDWHNVGTFISVVQKY